MQVHHGRAPIVPGSLMKRCGVVFVALCVGCARGSTARKSGDAVEDTGTTDTAPSDSGSGTEDPCALDALGDAALLDAPIVSADELLNPASPGSPVDEDAFGMPEDAPAALHLFEGRLALADESDGQMDTHVADYWISEGQTDSTLPEIDLEFAQCGRHLLPAQRGRIITENPYWDLFVLPGHAWSTDEDQGMSRAAFPFALTFKVENCLQNGVMTFLYDDESVSEVRTLLVGVTLG